LIVKEVATAIRSHYHLPIISDHFGYNTHYRQNFKYHYDAAPYDIPNGLSLVEIATHGQFKTENDRSVGKGLLTGIIMLQCAFQCSLPSIPLCGPHLEASEAVTCWNIKSP
jgi:hypothetical protein